MYKRIPDITNAYKVERFFRSFILAEVIIRTFQSLQLTLISKKKSKIGLVQQQI